MTLNGVMAVVLRCFTEMSSNKLSQSKKLDVMDIQLCLYIIATDATEYRLSIIMAALRNRAGHSIFPCDFFLSSSFIFLA